MRRGYPVVTIDGPAAGGKSTVARRLATRLGYGYLPSGAIYRAVAWQVQRGASVMDAVARTRIEEHHDGMVSADHRFTMAPAVPGLVAEGETVVDDLACVAMSLPEFAEVVNTLAGGPSVMVED